MAVINLHNKREVYVVFSSTTTKIGKGIRLITRNTYNHVALSLDPELQTLYSFSRHHKNAPLYGGFTAESLLRYLEGGDATLKVCELSITEAQYAALVDEMEWLGSHPERSVYNLFSAMFFPFGRRVYIRHAYTCEEFVIHMLIHAKIATGLKPNRFYSILDMERILADKVVYEGPASAYPCPGGWGEDEYNQKQTRISYIKNTAKNVSRLVAGISK